MSEPLQRVCPEGLKFQKQTFFLDKLMTVKRRNQLAFVAFLNSSLNCFSCSEVRLANIIYYISFF